MDLMSGSSHRLSSIHGFLAGRETGATNRLRTRPFLSELTCEVVEPYNCTEDNGAQVRGGGTCSVSGSMAMDNSETGSSTLPFALCYNHTTSKTRLLAVGDEDGYLTIVDPSEPLPAYSSSYGLPSGGGPKARWVAHNNAIFDACWNKSDHRILTASGDQTIMLWSTLDGAPVGCFSQHKGSVKTVECQPDQDEVFASGSRDGVLALWDARLPATVSEGLDFPVHSPVAIVKDAHKRERTKRHRGDVPPKVSVTSVAWLSDGVTLASAGAASSVIKIWDIRKLKQPRSRVSAGSSSRTTPSRSTRRSSQPGGAPSGAPEPAPRFSLKLRKSCLPFGRVTSEQVTERGVTWLKVHQGTNRLLASCSDSCHYVFDALRPELGSLASFSGHQTGSFYVKADFSPCGTHFVSGSTDEKLYVWQVDRPQDGPYTFEGHSGEVCDVAWCPDDFFQIATSSDDASVRLWSVARGKDGPQAPRRLQPPPPALSRTVVRTEPEPSSAQKAAGPSSAPSDAADSAAARSPLAPVQGNRRRLSAASPAAQTPAAKTPSSVPLQSSIDPSPMLGNQWTPAAARTADGCTPGRLWAQPTPRAAEQLAGATREPPSSSGGGGGGPPTSLRQVSIQGFLSVPPNRRPPATRRRLSVPGQPGQLSISSFFRDPADDGDRQGGACRDPMET